MARDLALKMDASLRVIHVVPQGGDPWKSAVALTDAANTLTDTACRRGHGAPLGPRGAGDRCSRA